MLRTLNISKFCSRIITIIQNASCHLTNTVRCCACYVAVNICSKYEQKKVNCYLIVNDSAQRSDNIFSFCFTTEFSKLNCLNNLANLNLAQHFSV